MAVTKRARFEVFRRDGHRCHYCGITADGGARLTIDHVTPVSLGGSDHPSNLVTACSECNSGKSSVPSDAPTVAIAAETEGRWKGAIAEAATLRPVQTGSSTGNPVERAIQEKFRTAWDGWIIDGKRAPREPGWRATITGFVRAGLPWDDMSRLIDVTMRSKAVNKWRYYCGCGWNRVRQIQEHAVELIADSHTCACAEEAGRDEGATPHETSAECAAYAEGTSRGYSSARADRTSGDAVSRDLNRRAILDLLAVASAVGGASAHELDHLLANGPLEMSLPSEPRDPDGWVKYLRAVIRSTITTDEPADADCGHCATCADRRDGEFDVDPCVRVTRPCAACGNPACNYPAGFDAGFDEGMQMGWTDGSELGRERGRRDCLAATEADFFLRAMVDLAPMEVRASRQMISIPTRGDTSAAEGPF